VRWFPRSGYRGIVEFVGRSPPRDQYKFGRGHSLESQRNYGPHFLFRGTRTPPMRQEWSSHEVPGWIGLTGWIAVLLGTVG
jgi:hypothetical protein